MSSEGVLVEVVADPGPVGQQVFDRHVVGDEGQVVAEQRARGRVEREGPSLDQGHDRQCRQALGAARGRELGLDRVGDGVGAVGEPVCRAELGLARAVEADHPGEPGALRRFVHRDL